MTRAAIQRERAVGPVINKMEELVNAPELDGLARTDASLFEKGVKAGVKGVESKSRRSVGGGTRDKDLPPKAIGKLGTRAMAKALGGAGPSASLSDWRDRRPGGLVQRTGSKVAVVEVPFKATAGGSLLDQASRRQRSRHRHEVESRVVADEPGTGSLNGNKSAVSKESKARARSRTWRDICGARNIWALALLQGGAKPPDEWVSEDQVEKVLHIAKEGFQANYKTSNTTKTYAAENVQWCPHFLRFLMFHAKPVENQLDGSKTLDLVDAYGRWCSTPEGAVRQYSWKEDVFQEQVAPFTSKFLATQVAQILLKGVLELEEAKMCNGKQADSRAKATGKHFATGKYYQLALVWRPNLCKW